MKSLRFCQIVTFLIKSLRFYEIVTFYQIVTVGNLFLEVYSFFLGEIFISPGGVATGRCEKIFGTKKELTGDS